MDSLPRLEQGVDISGREACPITEDHRRSAEDVDLTDSAVPVQTLGQTMKRIPRLNSVDGLRHGQARSRAPEPMKMPRIRKAPGE